MATRKLIRPETEPTVERGRGVRRKSAPPEQTNAEEYYYLKQMGAKTSMVIVLVNDEELTGEIEWYDKNAIKLNRVKAPSLVILKHNIRYLYKTSERKRTRRTARPKPSGDGEE